MLLNNNGNCDFFSRLFYFIPWQKHFSQKFISQNSDFPLKIASLNPAYVFKIEKRQSELWDINRIETTVFAKNKKRQLQVFIS